MTSADLLHGLWLPSLAVMVAVCVLLLLPRLLRRRFGAGVAYAAWWMLPAALVASLLPARIVETAPQLRAIATQAVSTQAQVAAPMTEAADRSWLWLLVWAAGLSCMAWRLWRQQHRFVVALGRVRRWEEDLWLAEARHGLPALLGALRPRIVLPDDFERRYDARERVLMLAHERQHLRRGDHLANLAVALLRCVFWFNPLVHLAAARFRHDQELACDQAVIAAHPDSRRTYGEAMLKTLMADRQAPLGCHWGFSHPLKERVMQLKTPAPRAWARRLGVASVAMLTLGAGFAVWSAQPPRVVSPSDVDFIADVRIQVDGGDAGTFAVGSDFGKSFSFAHRSDDGGRVDVDATVSDAGGSRYDIAMILKRNGETLAKPRMIVARGTPAVVKIAEQTDSPESEGVEIAMTIAGQVPTPPAPPAPPSTPPAPPAPSGHAKAPSPPPAPPASPASPSAKEAPAPPAPPSPPDAMATQAEAVRHARVAETASADAAYAAAAAAAEAAAAAKDAQEAVRAAESATARVDSAAAKAIRARAAAMTAEEHAVKQAEILERIAHRRDELRATAAARDAAATPAPSAP